MTASIVPLEPRRRETVPELPAPLTALVGRDQELAEARGLLLGSNVRLLTLTGPGGVGKTRFALALAHDLRSEFPDGAAFVSLASSASPEMVLPAIARGLAVRDEGDRPLRERLLAHLRTRRMLLVLDNFEQVVEAAPVVSDLLTATPDLKVLVTSSMVLRVQGEHEYPLRPLMLPQDEHPNDLDELGRVDAVALFVQRARTVRPDFVLTEANAPIIAEICYRLDGLPLAIELAAARSKVLSPSDLLARLDRRFQVLVSNSRDVPERQQTMHNAIEWGYNLLDAEEQELFRSLSVFCGGWTLPAAEAVCHSGELDVLDGLASLTDKSLVRQRETSDGELRFSMLETIRDFGLERLAESGCESAVREAHARYFEQVAAEASDALIGSDSTAWMDRLEREHSNFRSALEWIVMSGEGARGMVFGAGLWRFWETRGYLNEGRRWLDRLFSLPGAEVPTGNRAIALFGYGRFTYNNCEYETAEKLFNESYAIASDIGDVSFVAGSMMQLGHIALVQGDYSTARERYDRGLALRRASDDTWGTAMALMIRGRLSELMGELSQAREYYEISLSTFRDVQYPLGTARVLCHLGNLAMHEGHLDESITLHTRGLWELRESGDLEGIGLALLNMGLAHRLRGERAESHAALSEAITRFRDLGAPPWVAACIEVFAELAADAAHYELAVQLAAVAAEIRAAKNTPIPLVHRGRHDRLLSTLRQQLGNEEYVLAWEMGRLIPVDEAVANVVAGLPGDSGDLAGASSVAEETVLTRREIEIVRLVADGLSNQEIAAQLYISPRTTTTHISNILRKLSVSSRTAAVAAARRQRLL